MTFKLYFILIISCISIIYSQIIDTIIISGNKRTNSQIILRELSHPLEIKLDSILLNQDQNKLYNLGLFSKVDIYSENNIYKIDLIESFSVVPVPIINHNEDTRKWTLGAAIVDINFLGKNQKIALGITFTGEKMYVVNLFNPWFFGNHGSIEFDLRNIDTYNIFHKIKINKIFSSIKIGSYYKDFNKFNFLIGNKKYDEDNIFYNFNEISFNYTYDKRDIYVDPTGGYLFNTNLIFSKNMNDKNDISKIYINFNYYMKINMPFCTVCIDPVLSYKIKTIFKYPSFKELPLFEHEYLGGEDFTRGYSSLEAQAPTDNIKNILEQSNIIYNSFELQSTILKRKNYSSNKFLGFEFGIDGLLFIDIGLGSKQYNNFNFNNMLIGYGFGFKFFMGSGLDNVSILFGYNPHGQTHVHMRDD